MLYTLNLYSDVAIYFSGKKKLEKIFFKNRVTSLRGSYHDIWQNYCRLCLVCMSSL